MYLWLITKDNEKEWAESRDERTQNTLTGAACSSELATSATAGSSTEVDSAAATGATSAASILVLKAK